MDNHKNIKYLSKDPGCCYICYKPENYYKYRNMKSGKYNILFCHLMTKVQGIFSILRIVLHPSHESKIMKGQYRINKTQSLFLY